MASDIGQAEISSLEAVSQLLVIESEEVLHRRMEVMDLDHVIDCAVAQVVGCAVGDSSLDAASCQKG